MRAMIRWERKTLNGDIGGEYLHCSPMETCEEEGTPRERNQWLKNQPPTPRTKLAPFPPNQQHIGSSSSTPTFWCPVAHPFLQVPSFDLSKGVLH